YSVARSLQLSSVKPSCGNPVSSVNCFTVHYFHPKSTLFPYTTLFRSTSSSLGFIRELSGTVRGLTLHGVTASPEDGAAASGLVRSEEHTSELQSRENLVCRLLLEKKNTVLAALISEMNLQRYYVAVPY